MTEKLGLFAKTMMLITVLLRRILSLYYLTVFSIAVFICATLYFIFLLFYPREGLWRVWVRPCAWLCLRLAGQKIVIKGNIPDLRSGPYLYLINHQSFFDAFLLGWVMPNRITALGAANYFKWPIWGWMLKLHGFIPVERGNHEQAISSIKFAEWLVGRGNSVVIFPEGERSLTGNVGEFKKGAFHLAKNAQATIIPCVIDGAYQSWRRSELWVNPGTIIFEFLEPISYDEYYEEFLARDGINGVKSLVRGRIVDGLFNIALDD
jgi:1-acyl-sn-glycerol-3-phosphate acyltransferase